MATYNPFYQFVEDLANGVHNLGSDTLKVALLTTANAPTATDAVYTDLTSPVSTANLSSVTIVATAPGQTTGTYKHTVNDLTMTSTGGNTAAFRYIAIYNDTPTSPADPLIGWYDYGSALALATNESLTIDFSTSQVLLSIVATG